MTQKVVKKSPSGHHRTTLSGYIFATKARINNRKKLGNQQYLLHTFPQYGELRPTSGWDRSGSLGHPCKFHTPQPFYSPFSGTTRVSQCQKKTSGLYGARED